MRLWNWNLIKICVWTCDMNSTLGSVVPLAMFLFTCSQPLLFILLLSKTLFYFPWFVQNKDIFLKSAFCRELRASDLPPQVALYDLHFVTFHSFIAYYWSPFIRLLLHLFFLHGSEQQAQALDCLCLTNSYLEAL